MKKLFIIILIFSSCKTSSVRTKSNEIKKNIGYLIEWKEEYLFFPSDKSDINSFLKSSHKDGFKLDASNEISRLFDLEKPVIISYNFYDKSKDLDTIKVSSIILNYKFYNDSPINGKKIKLQFYYENYESVYNYFIYPDISILSVLHYSK